MGDETKPIDQKALIFALLDDLRTPGLVQVKGVLERPGGGNCCLGRACRVAMAMGLALEAKTVPDDEGGEMTSFDGNTGFLPESVRAAYGLNSTGGRYEGLDAEGYQNYLTNDNDFGRTFPEIADTIEAKARSMYVNGDEVAGWIGERKAARHV